MAVAVAPETGLTHEVDVVLIPITEVTPAPDNPRRQVGDVGELAQSISSVGLLEPILVVPIEDGYMVVCGHRRLEAVRLAGLTHVPAIVRDDLDDRGRQEAMLVENLQRTDLSILEEAEAYRRLVELGIKQRDLAVRVGRSQGHVSKRLALLELPDDLRTEVDSGGITVGDALELVKLKDDPDRLRRAMRHQSWETTADVVARELRDRDREKKLEAREEELESQGTATVRVSSPWNLPRGVFKVSTDDSYHMRDALPLDPVEHAKGNCHAIAITPNGDEFPVCTDRKQHPKVKTRAEKDSPGGGGGETAAQRREREQLEQAVEHRREFIRSLIEKKTPLPKGDAIALLVRTLLRTVDDWQTVELAAEWLGVVPELDLSETTVFRTTPDVGLHAAEGEEQEDESGATRLEALCGRSGIATDIRRPAERKTEPDTTLLCPQCARRLGERLDNELEAALVAYLERNEANLLRAGVAIALAHAEEENMRGFGAYYWRADDAREYVQLLKSVGYEPTAVELKKLAEDGTR